MKGTDEEVYEIQICQDNLRAVEVFNMCQFVYAGMNGTCTGFAASEILATISSFGYGKNSKRLFREVKLMGQSAADFLNKSQRQE